MFKQCEQTFDKGGGQANLVDRLEKRGLVGRQTSTEDGRAIEVVATESGLALAEELEALESRQQGRVLGQLSEDTKRALRENLDELLDALLRN